MNPPSLLAAGQQLTSWIRQGGRPERSEGALWLYRWRAIWLERNYRRLLNNGPGAQESPFPQGKGLIFIQGFWRSGTTLAHELLAALPVCAAPQTWQCMDPCALLVPKVQPGNAVAVQRPMDQVMVSARSPQEDEFALLAMGVPSVYRGFVDPRRLPELTKLVDPHYWTENSDWLEPLQAFLAWCRDASKPHLVVKSPNHIFRTPALARHFPEARFVWMLRDPEDLWGSNRKMWNAMIERYSLWNRRAGELELFLETALQSYADLLESLLADGSFRSQAAVGYEAFVANPHFHLPVLIDHLGLGPWHKLDRAMQSALLMKPVAATLNRGGLSQGPQALMARLRELHAAVLEAASAREKES
jgi:hypothetical protein